MLVLVTNDAVASSTIIPFAQDDNQRRTVCRPCLASDMSTADLAGQTGRARCFATACSKDLWAMEKRPGQTCLGLMQDRTPAWHSMDEFGWVFQKMLCCTWTNKDRIIILTQQIELGIICKSVFVCVEGKIVLHLLFGVWILAPPERGELPPEGGSVT